MKCPRCNQLVPIKQGLLASDAAYGVHFATARDMRPCEMSGKPIPTKDLPDDGSH